MIRMLTLACGPHGTWEKGRTYTLDAATEAALVDGGYATRIREPEIEVATVPEPENAATRTKPPSKRRR